uniref:Uncharacterized protein n=1 Tax=Anguilla anguilla TaxID=7936 RepID=A0A0E9SKN9_ANGAN
MILVLNAQYVNEIITSPPMIQLYCIFL